MFETLRCNHIGIIVWPGCRATRRSYKTLLFVACGVPPARTKSGLAKSSSNENPESRNVLALFDAALRQQLQGPPCAGTAECTLSRDRDRHIARREPHAGISRDESERPGAAAGSRGRPLSRRIQRHPLVCRRRHFAGAGIADRARRSAAVDVLRT